MNKPKLSVGLPVYNGEKFLRNALDSLLGQDFKDFELIISDNASTDGTAAICKSYAERDPRIRYLRCDVNQGATWNFRRVLELAEAPYFKWAAHDDECHPAMFRRCLERLEQSGPAVVLAYAKFEFIDEAGTVIMQQKIANWDCIATTASTPARRLGHVLWMSLFGPPIYGVFRTEILRQTRRYGCVAPDWVKLAEVAVLGKIVEVPEVLFRLRCHKANTAVVYKAWRDLLVWHDPAFKEHVPRVPYDVAIVMEYLKGIQFLRLPAHHKMMCYGVALAVPPARGIWLKALRLTHPARKWLQTSTGWRWLSVSGANASQHTSRDP